MSYYFLGAMITPPQLEVRSPLTLSEYKGLLENNLSRDHLEEMRRVLHYFDLENLQLHNKGLPITGFGNWSSSELEQVVLFPGSLEPWLENALEKMKIHASDDFREIQLHFFEQMTSDETAASKVIQRIWLTQWVSAYFRAKLLGKEEAFLQEPGADHPLIESLLTQLASRDSSSEYQRFKAIFETEAADLEALSKATLDWQLEYLEQDLDLESFTLERLLVHLVQLAWIERWQMRHNPEAWDPVASTLATLKENSKEKL